MPATLYPEPDALEAYRESNPTLSIWEAIGATSSPATPMPPLPPPPAPPEPGVPGSAYAYPEPDDFEAYREANPTLSVWEALGYSTTPSTPPPEIDGLATQAEAEAGVLNNKWMSPLRVKQAIGTVTLAKSDVGLGNVDNTSDLNKPISTATQTALDGKAATVHTHTAAQVTDFNSAAATAAPVQSVAGKTGTVTLAKGDVGLGNVDNTSDLNKPISSATQTALDGKQAVSSPLATHIRPSGTNNVFVSSGALASTSNLSHNNTAVGANALTANVGGDNNVAIGSQSLYSITGGNSNIGIGYLSLSSNKNGNNNIGIGTDALKNCDSPDANIGIGTQAGKTIDDGGSNIIIGHEADVDDPNRQRCIVLGRSAVSPAVDGSLAIGGTGGNVMAGLTTATAPTGATGNYLRIWLNGTEYRIPIQAAT